MLSFLPFSYMLLSAAFVVLFVLSCPQSLSGLVLVDLKGYFWDFGVSFDWLSWSLLSGVSLIAGSVLVYSADYMSDEAAPFRFLWVLMVFVGSMLMLVSASDLLSLFVGWEGLGLSSYFLVLYYGSFKAQLGSYLTAVSNRVGDTAMVLILFIVFSLSGSQVVSSASSQSLPESVLSLLFMVGCVTKSAQFPFCSWLPAAMAAPTPVSSLVHSSTLVAAGVFVVLRVYPLFLSVSLLSLGSMAGVSLFLASLNAVVNIDLKKTVALSTLSQLSVMVVGASLGLVELAYFHLLGHAFVKAGLFLGAGALIHEGNSSQDSRCLASHTQFAPLTLLICLPLLSLVALPFLVVFYSKETLVLAAVSAQGGSLFSFSLVGGSCLTTVYSLRLALSVTRTAALVGPLKGLGSNTLIGPGMLGLMVLFAGVSMADLTEMPLHSSTAMLPLLLGGLGLSLGYSSLSSTQNRGKSSTWLASIGLLNEATPRSAYSPTMGSMQPKSVYESSYFELSIATSVSKSTATFSDKLLVSSSMGPKSLAVAILMVGVVTGSLWSITVKV